MKVVSANLNGIRAASRKGFFEWIQKEDADIVCVQETKAQMSHLNDPALYPDHYHVYFADAVKKGYSGVGIYTKEKPENIITELGWSCADDEGRYVQVDFEHISVASLYMPSGSSGDERQTLKFEFMAQYFPVLKNLKASGKPFVICGDWNIVHKEIDIKHWKSNQKSSGCLPEERAWLDDVFNKLGWVDAFRVLNKEANEYTWWSYRAQARSKNIGWRIDYQVVTPDLKDKITDVRVYRDENFSDHAPLIVEYDVKL